MKIVFTFSKEANVKLPEKFKQAFKISFSMKKVLNFVIVDTKSVLFVTL